jgi:hypothetical protein
MYSRRNLPPVGPHFSAPSWREKANGCFTLLLDTDSMKAPPEQTLAENLPDWKAKASLA